MSLNVERRGSGTPIVLIHGIGSRWQIFEPVMDALAVQHEVIAIDLPGFGASELCPGIEPGPYGFADWLEGWLAEEGITKPHVVGNSMGGGIALEMGRRGVAASATAFSPIGFWRTPGLVWTRLLLIALRSVAKVLDPILPALAAIPPLRAALIAGVIGHPFRVAKDVAVADARGLARASGFSRTLRRFPDYRLADTDEPGGLIDIPVTIAWGTRDVLLTYRTQSAHARRVLPFVRHVPIPTAGHVPFGDAPAVCADLILATTGA